MGKVDMETDCNKKRTATSCSYPRTPTPAPPPQFSLCSQAREEDQAREGAVAVWEDGADGQQVTSLCGWYQHSLPVAVDCSSPKFQTRPLYSSKASLGNCFETPLLHLYKRGQSPACDFPQHRAHRAGSGPTNWGQCPGGLIRPRGCGREGAVGRSKNNSSISGFLQAK